MGVAAVWDKRKGLDDIVELSKQIEDQIIVVGVSEEQLRVLPTNIKAYTRTNNVEELRRLYAVADIFVNPTYEDNFPTTNIEALACGTPVVTYNTGGSPEAADKVAGKVVDKGMLCSGIDIRIGVRICQERSRKFTSAKMTELYVPLY